MNESTISMILGAAVVIVIGILVVNYFRQDSTTMIEQKETCADYAENNALNIPAKCLDYFMGGDSE